MTKANDQLVHPKMFGDAGQLHMAGLIKSIMELFFFRLILAFASRMLVGRCWKYSCCHNCATTAVVICYARLTCKLCSSTARITSLALNPTTAKHRRMHGRFHSGSPVTGDGWGHTRQAITNGDCPRKTQLFSITKCHKRSKNLNIQQPTLKHD